ncbi:hypothetical protein VNO77_23292 [Canavalia gladiata]|uniref:Uncharacterized protein n=1 Tax=Canavalia gladiata TaxID=3824 RepID=A0AAN9L511_CANGL
MSQRGWDGRFAEHEVEFDQHPFLSHFALSAFKFQSIYSHNHSYMDNEVLKQYLVSCHHHQHAYDLKQILLELHFLH